MTQLEVADQMGAQPPEVVFNIVLVENDPLTQRVVAHTVADERAIRVVAMVASAVEAEEAVRAAEPDLVVLDNQIDGPMTGVEVAPRLRQISPGLKIVLFTSDTIRELPEEIDAVVGQDEAHLLLPMIRILLRLPLRPAVAASGHPRRS